jgi:hypothetical protein
VVGSVVRELLDHSETIELRRHVALEQSASGRSWLLKWLRAGIRLPRIGAVIRHYGTSGVPTTREPRRARRQRHGQVGHPQAMPQQCQHGTAGDLWFDLRDGFGIGYRPTRPEHTAALPSASASISSRRRPAARNRTLRSRTGSAPDQISNRHPLAAHTRPAQPSAAATPGSPSILSRFTSTTTKPVSVFNKKSGHDAAARCRRVPTSTAAGWRCRAPPGRSRPATAGPVPADSRSRPVRK